MLNTQACAIPVRCVVLCAECHLIRFCIKNCNPHSLRSPLRFLCLKSTFGNLAFERFLLDDGLGCAKQVFNQAISYATSAPGTHSNWSYRSSVAHNLLYWSSYPYFGVNRTLNTVRSTTVHLYNSFV